MTRWKRFVSNVGKGNALKTLFVGLIALVIAVASPEAPMSFLAFLLPAAMAALLRTQLAARPGLASSSLKVGGLALAVAAFGAGFFKEELAGRTGVLSLLVALMTFYVSAFFWLWSDPGVVRQDRRVSKAPF